MTPLTRTAQQSYKKLKLMSRPVIVLPLITFVIILIISIIMFIVANDALDSTRSRMIERRAQDYASRLSNRLSAYTIVARGGAGYASVAGDVTADGWKRFVSAYNLSSSFPSINAVTYAQVFDKQDAQSYIDQRNEMLGKQEFMLDPNKPSGEPYILTQFVAPDEPVFNNRLGIDEYEIPSRKSTIEQAIETNRPTITDTPQQIRSVSNGASTLQAGLIIFAPIYDQSMPLDTPEQRMAALRGTSNVSLVADTLFDSIYGETERQTRTYITVYQGDGTQAPKIYEGGVRPSDSDRVPYVQKVQYGGQTFTYAYEFSDSDLLTSVELYRPFTLLIAGLLLGFLIALIMLFLIRSRLHKITSDKEHEIQVAKDELLSLASHQLRTPATGVKQYMGMVLQGFAGDITDQQKEFLQKAYDSNDRQLHIINDILHLAKLDAGRIVLSKTTFDMSELVRSVIEDYRDNATEAEIKLTNKLPKSLEVYADSHMMRMVVENLISNAIKYTHPGGKVSVLLTNTADQYMLAVKDTGVGIADTDLDKLFKQFSRVDNERSHLVSGTGVGLYLVKNLVELHGGKVSLESKLAKGTTFTITFPHETQ